MKIQTFPENSISLFQGGKEYQGFKSSQVITKDCLERPPIHLKLSSTEKIPRTYYPTRQLTKLRHMALLPDPLAVRLLIVLPSRYKHSIIECHLCSDSLRNKPRYTALAYSWAPNNVSYGIMVNRQSFYVGENLFHALRSLRHWREPRVFWVDAICINMVDLTERSSQVRLMTEVYGSAERVCVWLGDTPNEDRPSDEMEGCLPKDTADESAKPEQCIEIAHYAPLSGFSQAINQYEEYISKDTTFGLSHLSSLWRQVMQKVLKSIRNARYKKRRGNWVWKGNEIFDQRFWRSCWIVQEVVVAATVTVRLGSFIIDWEDIPDVRGFYEFLDAPEADSEWYQRKGDTCITRDPHMFSSISPRLGSRRDTSATTQTISIWSTVDTTRIAQSDPISLQQRRTGQNLCYFQYSTRRREKS